jgi:hypothetical protein
LTDKTQVAADQRGSSRINREKSVQIRVDLRQFLTQCSSFHRRPRFVSLSGWLPELRLSLRPIRYPEEM